MSGTGNRRLIGWLTVVLVGLCIAGYITREQFAALFQSVLGVHT
jgi:hypothetical protein